jgi:dTDP-glucose 4,6-dehydratase
MPRALVTGAAGFVGSHLVDRLLDDGFEVVGVDSFLTGRRANLAAAEARPAFRLVVADVAEPFDDPGPLDWVLHFASPASPVAHERYPVETMRANVDGTRRLLDLAGQSGAAFFLASTSEIYGDAEVHPQPEDYGGTIEAGGPRSVYQRAKRDAEAQVAAAAAAGARVRVARIFNAYGPRMALDDGRVIPTLVGQALRNEPLTVHGDGSQTRSFQHVDDLTAGIRRLMAVDHASPVNLGSTDERTVLKLAELIVELTGSTSSVVADPARPIGSPRRRPDPRLSLDLLGWQPVVPLRLGLERTIAALRTDLAAAPIR